MKTQAKLILSALTIAMLALTGCKNDGNATTKKTTAVTETSSELDQVSYTLGYMMASNGKQDIPDLNIDLFEKGFRDGFSGDDTKRALTEEQMQKAFVEYQQKREKEMAAELETKGKTNKEAGDKWLAENKSKEGVKTTASGLQYKVITEGTGPKPKATDMVVVHYEGKTIDGKVFDSSYKRGQPAAFPLNGVIPGWTEALQLMPAGSKYELYIPSNLAYGEAGSPPDIEPNSVLIFTVELLDEESAKKAAAEAEAQAKAQQAQMEELMKQAEAQSKESKEPAKPAN